MRRTLLFCTAGDALLPLFCFALPAPVLWLGFTHLLVTLLSLHACLRRKESAVDPVMLPLGAVFGPGGMALFIWSEPLRRRFQRRRKLAAETIEAEVRFGQRDVTAPERLSRILEKRIRYPEPDEVGSLAQMLRYGDIQARYQALETVVISFEPRLSPLIAAALADADQTIRALAAAAATQISANLVEQRKELEAKVRTSSDLAHRFSLLLLLCDHGCHNQLLSQAQRARFCEEAYKATDDIEQLLDAADPRRGELEQIRSRVKPLTGENNRLAEVQRLATG